MPLESGKPAKRLPSISRRDFIKFSGMSVICVWALGPTGTAGASEEASWGFLLVDMKKCQGCVSCMLACSLAHEGVESLSLSRIQVVQNPLEKWPADLQLAQCRQCVEPACVAACPTGALGPDPDFNNVTTVDQEQCIGCMSCLSACPYPPGRAVWNAEIGRSQKCDLCAYTPFWDETGGPEGKQACLETCPLGAIVFTKVIPEQSGDDGYTVNLRDLQWWRLGFPLIR